jgi:hypothetical protein
MFCVEYGRTRRVVAGDAELAAPELAIGFGSVFTSACWLRDRGGPMSLQVRRLRLATIGAGTDEEWPVHGFVVASLNGA